MIFERSYHMKKALWTIIIALALILPVFHVTVKADDVKEIMKEYEDFSEAFQIDTNQKYRVTVIKYDEEGAPAFETFENYFKIVLPEDGYIYGTFYEGDLLETDLVPIDHDITVYTEQEDRLVELDNWKFGLAKGTYYVKGTFVYNVPGHFKISYTATDDWEKERNSGFEHATDIPENMKMNAWVEPYDEECFKFTVSEPGIVTIGLDYDKDSGDSEKTWSLDLMDAEGRMINGASGSEIRIGQTGLSAGTYYLGVELVAGESSDNYYQLYWDFTPSTACETEWNDDYEHASTIPLNQPFFYEITNVMTVHGNRQVDNDYFTFSLDAPGTVSISVMPETDGIFAFEFQDSERNLIRTMDLECVNGRTSTSWKLGLPAGDYYLLTEIPENKPCHITLNYDRTDSWEKEVNDTLDSATSIAPGTTLNGWLEDKNDNYTFTLTEPGYINVDLSYAYHDSEDEQSRGFGLSMLDSEGNDMAARAGSCQESSDTKTGISISRIGLDPGTYFLSIGSNDVRKELDNYYSLSLEFIPDRYCETEYNNDFRSADPIEPGKVYSAQMMGFSDIDYFKFEIPEDGSITIDTTSEAPCEISFRIYNSEETKITDDWAQGSDEAPASAVSDKIALAKGTYYLVTCGWETVPYTFRVNYEPDPGSHEHLLQVYEAQSATCGEEGNSEYWYCSGCGKYFSDASGSSEIAKESWVIPATGEHSYGDWVITAEPTQTAEGRKERTCSVCGDIETAVIDKLPQDETDDGEEQPPAKISIAGASVTIKDQTYTGKELKPALTVKLGKTVLRNNTDYTVAYTNNKNAGKAKVVIKGTGSYQGVKQASFTIKKAANPLKVTVAGKTTFKQKSLKKAAKITLKATKGKGKITYTLSKKAKKAKIKVTSKGKVTIPKKCKKGKYTITVKAAGNTNYKSATKTVTITIK